MGRQPESIGRSTGRLCAACGGEPPNRSWPATASTPVVVVRELSGSIRQRVFFCTRPDLWVFQILEGYSERWAIEVTFRDLKQFLGFADSSARKREAVVRVAPFVAYLFGW